MPAWEVKVRFTKTILVEANSYVDALTLGTAEGDALAKLVEANPVEANVLRQLGEPWVSGGQWYLDRDLRISDVICFDRSTGNRFTKEDVELLRCRINELEHLRVEDHWNGEGSRTVSFRVSGRTERELLPPHVRQALCAPRPAVSEHA